MTNYMIDFAATRTIGMLCLSALIACVGVLFGFICENVGEVGPCACYGMS